MLPNDPCDLAYLAYDDPFCFSLFTGELLTYLCLLLYPVIDTFKQIQFICVSRSHLKKKA